MLDGLLARTDALPDLLSVVLSSTYGVPATGSVIRAFDRYLAVTSVSWRAWCRRPGDFQAEHFLALSVPGNVIAALYGPPSDIADADRHAAFVRACGSALLRENPHYVQCLVDAGDTNRGQVALAAGFTPLAQLAYLERDAVYPWVDPPPPDACEWRSWTPQTAAEFGSVIRRSYEGSLDCPELTGLRPIEDVVAAHRAAGEWSPQMWELAQVDGSAAACLLLARIPGLSAVEVVYTGVAPQYRRRGLGRLLMRRALELARGARVRRIAVVVDSRNAPARRLYESFSFAESCVRRAFWLRPV